MAKKPTKPKPKKPKKRFGPKPGSPRKGPLDAEGWDLFEKLCGIQCTQVEVAEFFNCSVDTLATRIKEKYKQDYSEVFEQKRGRGKISLRRAQWSKAVDGNNVAMLIFLGKNYLGQSDGGDEAERGFTVSTDGTGVTIMPAAERLKLISSGPRK